VRRPCVLVTDGEHPSVLAACRGLAAAGYRVATTSEDRFPLAHWSRFSKERISLTGPRSDPTGYAERFADLVSSGRYEIVLPGTDPALLSISEGREQVEPHALLGLPPHKSVLESLDKVHFQRCAERASLTPPRGFVCSTLTEMEAAAQELGFPLISKPAASWVLVNGHLRPRPPLVVDDAGSLPAVATEWPVTLQQYFPDAGIVSCAAVHVEGKLLGFTVVRYERAYPPPAAKAAFAVTIAPPAGLRERIEAVLAGTGWTGIFELEMLELEGRLGAIDFNPRPFGWMALAVGAGANLPAIWCDHLLGRSSVPTSDARVGKYFRREDTELRSAVAHLRRGRVREAAAVLRPHPRVVHAHFRLDDPGPAVALLLSSVYNRRRFRANGDRRRRPQ
jgi:predicted ATP-grasp superfamily ATP-dependent carboligase